MISTTKINCNMNRENNTRAYVRGIEINYFFICLRKLWLFSHNIQCEQESDLVALGKLIHETSYSDKRKEYEFDDIKVDWLDLNKKVIHEVKKSDKVEDAHLWQLKYYLYYFKNKGMGIFTGVINYPKLKKQQSVSLSIADEKHIEKIIQEINDIVSLPNPPPIKVKKKICRSCSYMELCYI